MSQKIDIGVEAKLNAQGVEQGAQRINKALSDASKKKIDPVSDQAIKKVDALFQAYLKLDREMARRLKITNQVGVSPDQIDWEPVYQNAKFRAAKLRQLQKFLNSGGADFTAPESGGGGGNWRQTAGGMAANTAQAGLRAAGPVGNVAANALGTGMSAGFGAGLMGLLGGIAALGVGKLVSAVAENIEKAENNNIAYDRLKRTLGDVNISFEGLKSAVKGAGDGLRITYDEADRLAQSYARQANLRNGYADLPSDLGLGVGLARAFGLDPEQGVGFLGQMRGAGVTRDAAENRRMAILVGETIARSDAFAKADEVMEALANFATAQTRQSLVAANVAGYAGMFSSMVSSGISGLDPSGASSILARVNSSLSAGGARGEASQFFTAMVANRMGLDPLQMQVLREGGAFASKSQMFGANSPYARYMGRVGPSGSSTLLEETRKLMEERYAGESESAKLMRAQAFANHTGLNMNQAMALLSMNPNQMGDLERVLGNSLSSTNASGIAGAAKAMFGTDQERSALAQSLLNREDVSQSDKDRLRDVLANGSATQQKEVLAKLSAQYEQERTMGSDIRDSRAALDNIKTNIADKVVPYLLEAKKALLYIAGDGKKTPNQVMEEIVRGESEDRMRGIKEGYQSRRKALEDEKSANKNRMQGLNTLMSSGMISKEQYAQEWGALKRRNDEIDAQIAAEDASYQASVANEQSRTRSQVEALRGSGSSGGGRLSNPAAANQAMQFFMNKGLTREQAAGLVANLQQESGFNPGAIGDGGKAFGIAQWHPDRQAAIARRFGKTLQEMSYQEQLEAVWWEMTEGPERAAGDRLRRTTSARDAGAVVSRYYERPKAADAEAAQRGALAESIYRTPIPSSASGAGPGRGTQDFWGREVRVSVDPLTVRHEDNWGREVRQPESLQTRVSPANPNTYNR